MRLMLIAGTVAVATLLDLRVSQAAQMPWCAGTNIGGDTFHYNCTLPTYEMCVQEVIAGNRGFCSSSSFSRRCDDPHGARRGGLGQVNSAERDVSDYNLERKRTSSTSSAGLPKRRAADTYPCVASWPGPSWPCMSSDRYTQSTLNVAHHAKTSEVEGEIDSQIEYQEVQEGQASSAAQAAEGCCQHSGAGGCCNESSRLRRQARSRRSGVKRRRRATSF